MPMACATTSRYLEVFSNTVVVLRAEDQLMESTLREMFPGIQTVMAADSELGMGHSLAAGIRAADGWDYAFIALADMPFIKVDTLAQLNDQMSRALQSQPKTPAIIQPVCSGKPGHPVGFSHHFFNELAQLQGDQGAREVLKNARHQLVAVDVTDEGVLKDLDRPD